jgi:hypothetical protein
VINWQKDIPQPKFHKSTLNRISKPLFGYFQSYHLGSDSPNKTPSSLITPPYWQHGGSFPSTLIFSFFRVQQRVMPTIMACPENCSRGYTRECLSITVARRITSQEVIDQLGELFLERAIPEHIRSDNGPEFTARAVGQWLRDLWVKTLYIEPRSRVRMGTLNPLMES